MQLRPSDAVNLAGKTDEELGRRHLRQSSIALLLACNRKWELKELQGLELIETPRPLSLGSAFQKAIEMQDPAHGIRLLRGETVCDACDGQGVRPDPADTAPGPLMSTVACEWCEETGGVPIPGATTREEMTDSQLERLIVDEAIVEGASKLYLKTWPGGPGEQREFPFRVRLRSPWTGAYSRTFDLVGTADGVVDLAEPGLLSERGFELIENKLVGQISPQKVQRLPLDRQVAIYRYGIWRATGRKVETVRYRWVRKPQIRQKQNESLEEYAERIRRDYEERPDFYMHEEEPKFATTSDLLRIEAELWQIAEQVRAAMRGRIFVRNTAHCSDFGGCQFIAICTGDPDAMSLYRKKTAG